MLAMPRVRSHLGFLRQWQQTAGLAPAMAVELGRLARRLGYSRPVDRLHPRQVIHPLNVRVGTSDETVFKQVFVEQEYAAVLGLRDVHSVIDLGANVGYTSALFLSQFPRARVLAVEPDPENFAAMVDNLAPYGDQALLLRAAAWNDCRKGLAVRAGGDGGAWGRQVELSKLGEVDGYDLPALIGMLGGGTIDLLKIDIEGAEFGIFSVYTSWLSKVRNICIELHGEECRHAFFDALRGYEYELSRSGELTICSAIRRLGVTGPARSSWP